MTAEVVCGDSAAYMRGMVDGSVDAVLTDPPYAEKTHAGARTNKGGSKKDAVKLITFDSLTTEAFLAFAAEAVRVARRWVLSPWPKRRQQKAATIFSLRLCGNPCGCSACRETGRHMPVALAAYLAATFCALASSDFFFSSSFSSFILSCRG